MFGTKLHLYIHFHKCFKLVPGYLQTSLTRLVGVLEQNNSHVREQFPSFTATALGRVPASPVCAGHTKIYQPSRGVTKVRNNDKINHLPLMIVIWLHSQDSHLHSKCLFCSITSLFMSQKLKSFVGAFCAVIQWLQGGHNRQTNTY